MCRCVRCYKESSCHSPAGCPVDCVVLRMCRCDRCYKESSCHSPAGCPWPCQPRTVRIHFASDCHPCAQSVDCALLSVSSMCCAETCGLVFQCLIQKCWCQSSLRCFPPSLVLAVVFSSSPPDSSCEGVLGQGACKERVLQDALVQDLCTFVRWH